MSHKKSSKSKKKNNYWNDYIIDSKEPNYSCDILDGKLKIYNIPRKHRTYEAYIYALRYIRSIDNKNIAYVELKMIESLLFNDIIKLSESGKEISAFINLYIIDVRNDILQYEKQIYGVLDSNEQKNEIEKLETENLILKVKKRGK